MDNLGNLLMQGMQAANPGQVVGPEQGMHAVNQAMGMLQHGMEDPKKLLNMAVGMAGVPFIPRSPLEWASLYYISDKLPGVGYYRSRNSMINDVFTNVVANPKRAINDKLADGWNHLFTNVLKTEHYQPQMTSQKMEKLVTSVAGATLVDNAVDLVARLFSGSKLAQSQNAVALAAQAGVDLTDEHAVKDFIQNQLGGSRFGGILKSGLQLATVAAGVFSAFETELTRANIPGAQMLANMGNSLLNRLSIGTVNEFMAQQLYTEHMQSPETLMATLSDPASTIGLTELMKMKQLIEERRVDDPTDDRRKIEPPQYISDNISPMMRRQQNNDIANNNSRAAAWETLAIISQFKQTEKEVGKLNFSPEAVGQFGMMMEQFVISRLDSVMTGGKYPETIQQANQLFSFIHSQLDSQCQMLFEAVLDDVRTLGRTTDYLQASYRFEPADFMARLAKKGMQPAARQELGEDDLLMFFPPIGIKDRSVTIPEGLKAWEVGVSTPTSAAATASATSPFAHATPSFVGAPVSQDPDLAIAMMVLQLGSQREGGLSSEERALVDRVLNRKPTTQDTALTEVKASENTVIADQQISQATDGETRSISDETAITQAASEGAIIAAQQAETGQSASL